MKYTSLYKDTVFWLYETFDTSSPLVFIRCEDWDSFGVNPWGKLKNGDFDEYLPVYKHTFKPNGDGTYYWAKTELDTPGKQIPLSAIHPSLGDCTAEDLLAQVPISAYSGKEENIQTVSWGNTTNHGVSHIIFDELFRLGLLPKDMEEFANAPKDAELAACPKVSVEEDRKSVV